MNIETKTKLKTDDGFQKSAKWKNNQSSPMSNLSLCDLNIKGKLLKVHVLCPNSKCNGQKQNSFTPNQFQLEGASFTNTMKKKFKGSQSVCHKLLKPSINATATVSGMALAAKSKNAVVGQVFTST